MTFGELKKRYGDTSVNVRSGVWYTVCSVVQRGISFVTVPVFTRILTTEQYGAVSLYYTWQAVISIFCTLNLFAGVFNNGMIKYEENRAEYMSSMQGLVTTITAVFLLLYAAFHASLDSFFGLGPILMVVMFVDIAVNAAFSFWCSRERFEFRYKKMVAVTLLVSLLSPALAIATILAVPSEYGVMARVLASASATIAVYGAVYAVNFKKGKTFFNKEYWLYALRFNLPLLPHYLSALLLNQSDRIMIDKLAGQREVGIYSLSHNLAMILNIIVVSINNAFAPWLYRKMKKKDYDGIAQAANAMFLFVAAALLLLMAFSPEAVLIMGGKEYSEAIYVIPPLTVSLYFLFMYQIFANIEFYFEENKFIMYASVFAGVLNIVLNYVFIRMFGYIAAGYTTLVCYVFFGLSHFAFMAYTLKKNGLSGVMIFDIRVIGGIAAALVAAAGLMLALYDFAVLRYAVIAVILIISLIFRGKIASFIRKILKGEKVGTDE